MTDIKPFLEPISAESPCGKDISYDAGFLNLETLVKGKEETQFSPAEDPNWKEVQPAAIDLIKESKHLRVALVLTLALLENEGLVGFRNGVAVLKGWIDQYWDGMFPLLDPEDNNDPVERVNLLQSLSTPGSTADKFLERLAEVPLAESPSLGRYSLKAIDEAGGKPEIAAAFKDTDADKLRGRYDAVVEALALVKEMDGLLAAKIGRGSSPNFGDLTATLGQMASVMGPHCGGAPVEGVVVGGAQAAAGGGGGRAAASGASLGSINSRGDVVRALGAICDYYRSCEPASPIPLLLERAQRLVDKDFMSIISDLAPNALASFELLAPPKPPEIQQ